MAGIRRYDFGRSKANTFIGGVSATVGTAAALATKLGISAGRISNFKVVGSDIQCKITGGSYTIPASAFANNTSITYYNDSKSGLVTTINATAFKGCTALITINFPNCTTITSSSAGGNSGTFQGCTSLINFSAPKFTWESSVKDYMFFGCTALTSVYFPLYNGLIGGVMFNGCTNLVSADMTIVGVVGGGAFQNTKLATIDLTNVTAIGSGAFQNTKLTSVNLTNATSIGDNAFMDTPTLTSSITANNCTSVGAYSFRNTRITGFSSTGVFPILKGAFNNNPSLVSIFAPNVTSITSNNNINDGTFEGCSGLNSLTLTSFIGTTNTDRMFYQCTSLPSVSFPAYNGGIGITMFYGCTSLTSATIPVNGSIGGNAFSGTKISTFNFTNVTSIGDSAFQSVTQLTGSITANSCTSIGISTFSNTRITGFSSTGTFTINKGAFNNNPSLATFNAPNVVSITGNNNINEGVFESCSGLSTITLTSFTGTTNTSRMFYGCIGLTSVSFPAYNGSIGTTMFYGCSNLTSATIPVNGSIGDGAFQNTKVSSFNFTNVTAIGSNSFQGNIYLTGNITANNCLSLATGSFDGCTGITGYSFPIMTTISSTNAFKSNTAVTSIYMPSLTQLGSSVVDNSNFLNIKTGCTITVKASLQTANAGAPDGDLVYASGTRGATIVYV